MIEESSITIVDNLIAKAFELRASDIHIDPTEYYVNIKFRIDGKLIEQPPLPLLLCNDIIGRIKILSHLRTDEHHSPQDGRLKITLKETLSIDIRVSIVPSYYGESIVLRLLVRSPTVPTLEDLGMSEADQKKVFKALSRSSGMILVTGPTGSGKTTTLYTLLHMLNDGKSSIISIEDPIEYAVPGIRQIQTNHQRSLTFSSGLRSIVRQDPDIIMVGEIRDQETASIATHIALTGHILLSTIHTSDAVTTIPRLMDMGIDPYLVASTVQLVIAQRLIRQSCPHCEQGCEKCHGDGYLGRTGIFEVLEIDDAIRDAIMSRAPARYLRTIATQNGMTTIEHHGLEKVEQGITKIDEVIAAIIE